MVTDDAGVLARGGWELTLALEEDSRDAADSYLLPALEVAYGFSERLQGGFSVARVVVDEPGRGRRSDLDAMGLELKWLGYSRGNVSVALAPAYALPVSDSSTDRGLVDDVRVLSLPLIVTMESGRWSLDTNVAVGYHIVRE